MPNLGTVLKEEIRRLARREIRTVAGPLQKRLAESRRHVADLRRRVAALEGTVATLKREADARRLEKARTGVAETGGARIGARSIRSQRKRLKLTREEFGRVIGVSANTIYLWENGKVAPRGKSRAALIGAREMGAREARQLAEVAGARGDTKKRARKA